jgi:hypothetical protein
MKDLYMSPAIEVESLPQASIFCASGYDKLEELPLNIFEQDKITLPSGIW